MMESFDDFLREERKNPFILPKNDNAFRIELSVITIIWAFMTFVAQYCVLAETFGNNWFFATTNTVTTYVMHIICAGIAFAILRAKFFPCNNVVYVGLFQMSLKDISKFICAVNAMVVIVMYF